MSIKKVTMGLSTEDIEKAKYLQEKLGKATRASVVSHALQLACIFEEKIRGYQVILHNPETDKSKEIVFLF